MSNNDKENDNIEINENNNLLNNNMSNNDKENDNIEMNQNNNLLNNNITLLDLAKIQNDLLIQLNNIKNEMNNKFEKEIKLNEESLDEINTKFISLEGINKSFTNSISSLNVKIDNYKELNSFKKKAESQLITHEIKLNTIITDLNEAKFKYDKIYIDNLTLPGYIGQYAKYKNLSEYIYNNIQNISLLINVKDEMKEEIKELKNKVENMVKDVVKIVNSAELRCNMYSDNKCKILENDFKLENKIINDKIMEVRMNNIKEAIDLEKRTQEFQKEWDKILLIKNEISKKLIDHLLIYKTDADTAIKKYNEGKIEFDKVKRRFGDMVDFIKDVRFRKNLGIYKEISKREIKGIVNKLDFNRKSDSSDSDLDKVDLNYDFKTGKKIKDDVISDEEEYEKKKKVKKLVRRLTSKNIDFLNNEMKNNIDNNSKDKIKNVKLNNKIRTLSKNSISESDDDSILNNRKRLNTNINSIKNSIEEKGNKTYINRFIKNKIKIEKDESNNIHSYSKEEKNKKKNSDNLIKTKVNFDLNNPINKSTISNDNLTKKKINSNRNDKNSLEIEMFNSNLSKRSKSSKNKNINIQINKSRKNTPTNNNEKKYNNSIRKLTSPDKRQINNSILDKNNNSILDKNNNSILDKNIEIEQKKINQKIKENKDNNDEKIINQIQNDNKENNNKENNNNQNQENNNQNNKMSNSEYKFDNEELDIESSSSEKKNISLGKINKYQIKSYDNIIPINKKILNSSLQNSISSIEKKDKIEFNQNIKIVDQNINKKLDSPNKININFNKKIFTSPIYKKSVIKIKQLSKENSEKNINTNDYNIIQFPISERVLIEKNLQKTKKINYNITNQFNKSYNSITPLKKNLSPNNFIPDINLENNISLPTNIKKPNNYIFDKRPKDYDPEFNFNFIELGFNNNFSYNKLNNNDKSDIGSKNNLNLNKRKNLNKLNSNYNLSKTSLNIFQKENNEIKNTQNIININDIFPSSKKKIKFIKIGKTNYKDE